MSCLFFLWFTTLAVWAACSSFCSRAQNSLEHSRVVAIVADWGGGGGGGGGGAGWWYSTAAWAKIAYSNTTLTFMGKESLLRYNIKSRASTKETLKMSSHKCLEYIYSAHGKCALVKFYGWSLAQESRTEQEKVLKTTTLNQHHLQIYHILHIFSAIFCFFNQRTLKFAH